VAPSEQHSSPANVPQSSVNLALASVAGIGGCLVLIVVIIALFAGLWLDNTLGTKPLFTLLLVLGSVPVGIFLMYRVAIGVIARSQIQTKTTNSTRGEPSP
jgi:hypothetical protein